MVSNKTFITADELNTIPSIQHAFFTRQDGVSDGIFASRNIGLGSKDERDKVLENRARCMTDLRVAPENLATPFQIHSAHVVAVTEPWKAGEGPKADGLATDRPGVALGIATADCGPVLFADESTNVIGAAHAGWRGATGGVLEATLDAMENMGARRTRITAVLGPTIAQESYEVGAEFIDRLIGLASENERYLKESERQGHAMFNLPAYIIDRLQKAGIKQARNLGLDTYSDETRFFSYRRATHRREEDYGRLLSAIVLR